VPSARSHSPRPEGWCQIEHAACGKDFAAPAQVLQQLSWHKQIATTMGFYTSVDDAVGEATLGRKRNKMCNNARERSVGTCDETTIRDDRT
jgi:hypothetical protein